MRFPAFGLGDDEGKPVVQVGTVRQLRQLVVVGHVLQPELRLFGLDGDTGDVRRGHGDLQIRLAGRVWRVVIDRQGAQYVAERVADRC